MSGAPCAGLEMRGLERTIRWCAWQPGGGKIIGGCPAGCEYRDWAPGMASEEDRQTMPTRLPIAWDGPVHEIVLADGTRLVEEGEVGGELRLWEWLDQAVQNGATWGELAERLGCAANTVCQAVDTRRVQAGLEPHRKSSVAARPRRTARPRRKDGGGEERAPEVREGDISLDQPQAIARAEARARSEAEERMAEDSRAVLEELEELRVAVRILGLYLRHTSQLMDFAEWVVRVLVRSGRVRPEEGYGTRMERPMAQTEFRAAGERQLR